MKKIPLILILGIAFISCGKSTVVQSDKQIEKKKYNEFSEEWIGGGGGRDYYKVKIDSNYYIVCQVSYRGVGITQVK